MNNSQVQTTILPNGLKIMTERMAHLRSVALGVWVRSGSRRESEADNGISHFMEHMVFKGTKRRSAEQIARAFDSIGGHMDAFTSREMVCYNAKVIDAHAPAAFDIISDLVMNPLLRPEDMEKEKGVVLEEIKMDADNIEYQTHELFCRNFWKGDAIGRSILGTAKTVKAITPESLRAHFRGTYIAPNLLVTAAGRMEHEQIVKLAEATLGKLPKRKPLPTLPVAQTSPQISVKEKKSVEQVHLCLGAPSFPMPHPLRFVAYTLNNILGGGMSSRLFQNIREQQGLCYSIISELTSYRDTGCLAIYAGTSPETLRRVIDSVRAELTRIKGDRVTAEELQRSKDNLKGSIVLGLESTSSRMSNLARQEMFFGRHSEIDEILEKIEAVTAEQVQEVANEFLQPAKMGLTVMGRLNGQRFTRKDLHC
jgi:predicted Zn-dependent peptidase